MALLVQLQGCVGLVHLFLLGRVFSKARLIDWLGLLIARGSSNLAGRQWESLGLENLPSLRGVRKTVLCGKHFTVNKDYY